MATYNEAITELITVTDTLVMQLLLEISENIEVSDAVAHSFTGHHDVLDEIGVTDTLTSTLVALITVNENIEVDDTVASTGVFHHLIEEQIAVRVYVFLEGAQYTGWVFNASNAAVSEYTRFNFHSFAKFNNVYYGANEDGIYKLEGETDAGYLIKAPLRTGITDFNSAFQKRVPRAYLGIRSDGQMVLKTITNEDTERWYEAKTSSSSSTRVRVPLSKGVRASYWQFELLNVTGEDFELDVIDLMPIILSRRPL